MKAGVRSLGIAESYRGERSTLAGAVVRASRVVDGMAFTRCTVGGTDATSAITALWDRLDRRDVRFILIAGIAPAWYNVVDLQRIHDHCGRPVISVSFEQSDGLERAIRESFDETAAEQRLATYAAQPSCQQLGLNDETVFYRAVGCEGETPREILRSFTPEGGRPEPLRIARLAARAGDRLVETE